jgi:hypothetical protein
MNTAWKELCSLDCNYKLRETFEAGNFITVLNLTQVHRLKMLRRVENNVQGTRQNFRVTSGEAGLVK